MADVFLSYKREDRALAKQVAAALQGCGLTVFFDVKIDVGESFDARIEREIKSAKCVAVLWSKRSCESEWVRREARFGAQHQMLAPARIDDCEIPLEFSEKQTADLRGWVGDAAASEWVQFVKRIAVCAQAPISPPKAALWRQRYLPVAAGLAALVGVVLLGFALLPVPHGGSSPKARISPQNPVVNASTTDPTVPQHIWQMLTWDVMAGECEGLGETLPSVTEVYPGIRLVEAGLRRECARNAERLRQTISHAQTSAPVRVSPNFLASLIVQDLSPLTRGDFEHEVRTLGIEWEVLAAVAEVERGPLGGYAEDGRPIILFERHLFSRLTDRRFDDSHPRVSSLAPGGYPRTQAERWSQLEEAFALDPEAALKSTSWGRFQTLGQNYANGGFANARDFVASMASSERGQLRAFVDFIRANGLVDELQRKDWVGFASRFNGPAYAQSQYDTRMAAAYARLRGSSYP